MKRVKKLGAWKKPASRAFGFSLESPRVVVPAILGANGDLNTRAGFIRGNLEVTALVGKPGMCLIV